MDTQSFSPVRPQRIHLGVRKTLARRPRVRRPGASVTSLFVRALARRERVVYTALFADRWAEAVTRLGDDEVVSDATDDLLVALARAGKISASEQLRMLVAHHRV
ncbi:hypothetical protein [Castellaniella sp. UC4442_H9]